MYAWLPFDTGGKGKDMDPKCVMAKAACRSSA